MVTKRNAALWMGSWKRKGIAGKKNKQINKQANKQKKSKESEQTMDSGQYEDRLMNLFSLSVSIVLSLTLK